MVRPEVSRRIKVAAAVVGFLLTSILLAIVIVVVYESRFRLGEAHLRDDGGASEGKGGEEEEPSDLDRPVDELLAMTCEHGKPTYTCDECRYEVGVARVTKDLVQQGLIKVDKVSLLPLGSSIEIPGEIQFNETMVAHLGPRAPGIIKKVLVDLGQEVKTGQALLQIDSTELAEAKSQHLQAAAMLALAKKNYERAKELYEEKVTSEKAFFEAQQAYEAAKIQAGAAKGNLARLGFSPGSAGIAEGGVMKGGVSGLLTVRSPMNGTVLQLHAAAGELVEPGVDAVLIGDSSKLWIWGDLYENDLKEVTEHQKKGDLLATVTVKAYPGESFAGTVDFIGTVMDETTRTVKVRISVDNGAGSLLPGMFAMVALSFPGGSAATAVPAEAVLSDEGRDFVFVHLKGEYYIRRPVVVGSEHQQLVEIREGLEEGQEIVTQGAFLLKSDVLRSKMGAGCAD